MRLNYSNKSYLWFLINILEDSLLKRNEIRKTSCGVVVVSFEFALLNSWPSESLDYIQV